MKVSRKKIPNAYLSERSACGVKNLCTPPLTYARQPHELGINRFVNLTEEPNARNSSLIATPTIVVRDLIIHDMQLFQLVGRLLLRIL